MRAPQLASAGIFKSLTQAFQEPTLSGKREYLGVRVKGTSTSYENANMIPPQRSDCASPSCGRIATISAAAVVYVQERGSLLRTEVEQRSQKGLLRAAVESRIIPLLGQKVVGI